MVCGDGGFQMNIQELTTIKKYNLNVKMLVLDNCHLGMVRQWQELLCDKRYSETDMSDNPDFVKLGTAYGITCARLDDIRDARKLMRQLAESDESMLLHARIEPEENVLPMVPAGKSLNNVLTKI
jgi:acetolactate synthase-1/2/3 large subunit